MKTDERIIEQAHADYLEGVSLRKIGKKYGVSFSSVNLWAKKFGWDIERMAINNCTKTEHPDQNLKPVIDAMEDRALKIRQATDLAMGKIMQLLELDEPLAPRDLKSITSSIMDLKVLYGVKHDDERRETEARIRNLERSLDQNTPDTEMKIEFVNMEWDTDGNT